MSILSSQSLGSSSSSSHIHSQNPNLLNHGSDLPRPDPSDTLQSLHISDPADTQDNFTESSVSPTPEPSGGSSKKVKEPPGKKIPARQKPGAHFQHNGSGQSSMGFSEHRGPPGSHQRHRSNQGRTPPSAGRKSQGVNANHLLNFQYDPISHPQARPNPPRRLPERNPYNKDLFLQANYKFVLLDSGNRGPESMDPDKMLQGEDIICLKYFTPHTTTCPIGLEELLCLQKTLTVIHIPTGTRSPRCRRLVRLTTAKPPD
ncbi:putative RING-finger protein Mag2/Rnf10 [Helianthus annuus]|uniref:RING-finger protein Mag2/Rnf10 n=1 Tax=Helianthus annuus TaxID=4232 RepID=A0A251RRI7_HELAN|nr:putative RING-finger protein Mag2/Rnf10 [Helianthus annuus]KAJ0433462.1 putative RING-finger protein Mag2/Rnf10 [Helianthus annuus]KAJ0813156.1 putative RING-finger protein Mag2/Rnf10 [Helianthus annuus]